MNRKSEKLWWQTSLMVLCLGFLQAIQAQISIQVRITNSDQIPIAGLEAMSMQTGNKALSDQAGKLVLNCAPPDSIVIKYFGKKINTTALLNAQEGDNLSITIAQPLLELTNVEISASSESTVAREQAYAVTLAPMKEIEHKPGDVALITGQMPGVRLRTAGGLGSDYNLSLQGMSGNAVRIFLDGIPLEYFGKGFQLNNISPQDLSQIEVYKGAVPPHLGADVLGGAINLISKPINKQKLVLAYETGSFNTHRALLQATKPSKNFKTIYGITAQFNHSDNSFRTLVQTANFNSGAIRDTSVKRFHDRFTSYNVTGRIRWLDRKWADEAQVVFGAGVFSKQLQHGFTLTFIPVGNAHFSERYIPISFTAKKQLKQEKHVLRFNAAVNVTETQFIDTSSSIYAWTGQVVATNPQVLFGEIGFKSTVRQLRFTSISSQSYQWNIDTRHQFVFHSTQTFFQRTGSDTTIKRNLGFDPLAQAATLIKTISAAAYVYKSFNQRYTATFALKHYFNQIKGTENIVLIPMEPKPFESINQFLGWNAASAYQWKAFKIKLSYEYAGRLPNENEALGDGLFINGNPQLRPERSHNVNLNLLYSKSTAKGVEVNAEAGVFGRWISDIIVLQNALFIPQYENLFSASGAGAEAELSLTFKKRLELKSNATFIDLRNRGYINLADKPLEGKRIPNVPYLFANQSLTFCLLKQKGRLDRMDFYSQYQYVHAFFLFFDGGANDSKAIIPEQHNLSVGLLFRMKEDKTTLAFECRNITNAALFDNFRVQLPGRAVFIKMTHQF